jgi:hypothetical protein
MDGPAQLPPKPDVALALLQSAMSVYVHLDPRGSDVLVPAWFKKQPQLVLQVGMNMAVPIPDLDVGKAALSCTLSFNRRPEFCRIPRLRAHATARSKRPNQHAVICVSPIPTGLRLRTRSLKMQHSTSCHRALVLRPLLLAQNPKVACRATRTPLHARIA